MIGRCYPRVSIGVPVHNGERFLAETLDSLLSQTFVDIEIVISDNASTDRSADICLRYAAHDSRVRYYRNEVNRGAAWNHNRVFELAKGEFFKWNSADDICGSEFVAVCVAALDQDPGAVMACTQAVEVDQLGNSLPAASVVGNQALLPVVLPNAPAHVRFRQTIRLDHFCLSIYSLIRSHILRKTALIGGYADSDRVLLGHLALWGNCIVVPKTLLFNRDHPDRFTRQYTGDRFQKRATWFDPLNGRLRVYPSWRELTELLGVVRRTPLEWRERVRCFFEIVRWLGQKRQIRLLCLDATYYERKWIVRHLFRARAAWS